jgi:hypothetical protein
MKILWLAAYPSPRITREHPVPWIVALAKLLSRDSRVQLTILSWSSDIEKPVEEFDHDGIHFIYLRSPTVRNDILSLYQTRIRRTASYLRRHCHRYDLIHLHGSELQFQVAAAGLPVPLLSVQGLISECVKVLPGGLSWRRLLWSLARYYELKYLPRIPRLAGPALLPATPRCPRIRAPTRPGRRSTSSALPWLRGCATPARGC